MSHGLVDTFAARARTVDSHVHQLSSWRETAGLVDDLCGRDGRAVAGRRAVARLTPLTDALGERLVVASDDPGRWNGEDVGVAAGRLAVAETGSVVTDEHDLSDRLVAMLAPTLVQVVPRREVVGTLDEAADWLSTQTVGAGYAVLTTGPSRTADIERSLTIGVQGPGSLHVVLVEVDP